LCSSRHISASEHSSIAEQVPVIRVTIDVTDYWWCKGKPPWWQSAMCTEVHLSFPAITGQWHVSLTTHSHSVH